MAKANQKFIADYLRLDSTNAFLEELSADMGIPISGENGLIQIRKGGNQKASQGTWGHPQIAIHCGQWCSPAFAVKVTGWIVTWMNSGRNPLQSDLDRLIYRDALKDDARLRMTDQVKEYLEKIQRYDDRRFAGQYFARIHDLINRIITGETSRQMRDRLSELLDRPVKEYELIRDYFDAMSLQRYISVCEVTANLIDQGYKPLEAVEVAKTIVLPKDYKPTKIDFIESIKFVRGRATAPVLTSAT